MHILEKWLQSQTDPDTLVKPEDIEQYLQENPNIPETEKWVVVWIRKEVIEG